MKKLIKELLPPIIFKAIRPKAKFFIEKTYPTFEEALKDCDQLGYENDIEIAKIVLEKTRRYRDFLSNEKFLESDLLLASQLISLFITGNKKVNVIDVGGACGAQYFTTNKILGDKIKLNWSVVETENMCLCGNELAEEGLKFYSDMVSAKKQLDEIDLIISSGTIQYVPKPRLFLEQILNLGAKYILLTRLSLTRGPNDVICIQSSLLSENGIGELPETFSDRYTKYVHTNFTETDFNSIISKNHRIVLKFKEETGIHRINNEPIIGYGVLLEKL